MGVKRYLMIINGERKWLPIEEAGVAYDNGFVPVTIGGYVLVGNFIERKITNTERRKIVAIADHHSERK